MSNSTKDILAMQLKWSYWLKKVPYHFSQDGLSLRQRCAVGTEGKCFTEELSLITLLRAPILRIWEHACGKSAACLSVCLHGAQGFSLNGSWGRRDQDNITDSILELGISLLGSTSWFLYIVYCVTLDKWVAVQSLHFQVHKMEVKWENPWKDSSLQKP